MENIVITFEPSTEDILICGQCKISFNSVHSFLAHKREPCNTVNSLKQDFESSTKTCVMPGNLRIDENLEQNCITNSELMEIQQTADYSLSVHKDEKEVDNVVCMKCKKSFKKLKSLALHLKIHTGEKPFQCPICGRCFVQNTHLQRHLLSHKVWPDGLNNTTAKSVSVDLMSYSCSYCDMSLSNYSQFRVHLKKHISEKKFKCAQEGCLNLFDTLESLIDHTSTAHSNLLYTCHICSDLFNCLEDIARHHQYHNKNKPIKNKKKYECMHCDASFLKSEHLTFHLSTENHNKTCVHCKKVFVSDKRLRMHLQTHRQTKLFKCNICGCGFHMKKYLMSHMHKHGDRQFVCSICDYKFKRKDLLVRHLKSHERKKKFQCPFKDKLGCLLGFSRKDKFDLHMNYHMKRMTCSEKKIKTKTSKPSTVEILIVPFNSTE